MVSRMLITILGAWLIVSPELLDQPLAESKWWFIDAGIGATIVLCAWCPIARIRNRFAPLMLLLGGALIGAAYLDFAEPTIAAQNRAMVGVLIMICGLIRAGGESEDLLQATAAAPILTTRSPAASMSPLCRPGTHRPRPTRRGTTRLNPGQQPPFGEWKCWHSSRL